MPRRTPLLAPVLSALLLALPGCDAGNRADPGSDNAFACPRLSIASPFEGQQVVPLKAGSPVLALLDVTGGALGRGAGSRLRWRLERVDEAGTLLTVAKDGKPVPTFEVPWTTLDLPEKAVSLGALEPGHYRLVAEVLTRDGAPWTRVEKDAAGREQTLNAASTVVRRFSVHAGWREQG